jgi:hypothetical protein
MGFLLPVLVSGCSTSNSKKPVAHGAVSFRWTVETAMTNQPISGVFQGIDAEY